MVQFPVMNRFALLVAALAAPSHAAAQTPDFLAAALCEPPYSTGNAMDLYEAAEKLAKPDTSSLGAAIYHLPAPIERDGFKTQDVVFAGMSVGVLLEGAVAAELGKRYALSAEKSHLFGASTTGFARVLPEEQQGMKDLGLISIVAREGPAMPGKTLLACEFVSNEDRAALEAYDQGRP